MHSFHDMTPADRVEHIHALAHHALPLYGMGEDSRVKLLNHSENTTFLVDPPDRDPVILRINRPGYHSEEILHGEIAWIKSLIHRQAVGTAPPMAGLDGNYIQKIVHENYAQDLNCAMFAFLEGTAPDEKEESLIIEFEELGEVTARLHSHARSWKKRTAIKRPHWDFEHMLGSSPRWGRWQDGFEITSEREALYTRVVNVLKKRLAAYGMGEERYGLIHADLRLANLLVDDGSVQVIDFDDCGFGWYMYDLGAALSFMEHEPYVPQLVEAWIQGYTKIAPIEPEERAEIPTCIMLRRMMLVAWLGSHHETETAREHGAGYIRQTDKLAHNYLKKFE
jgi:Ser/Thr protein kinase RdoA (MazF antagonist)